MKVIQSKKGFTLLEVLFALAIFSIGLMAIIGMTTMTIKSNYMSKNLTTAVHLAQNKLETLKAGLYDDIDNAGLSDGNRPEFTRKVGPEFLIAV